MLRYPVIDRGGLQKEVVHTGDPMQAIVIFRGEAFQRTPVWPLSLPLPGPCLRPR